MAGHSRPKDGVRSHACVLATQSPLRTLCSYVSFGG